MLVDSDCSAAGTDIWKSAARAVMWSLVSGLSKILWNLLIVPEVDLEATPSVAASSS